MQPIRANSRSAPEQCPLSSSSPSKVVIIRGVTKLDAEQAKPGSTVGWKPSPEIHHAPQDEHLAAAHRRPSTRGQEEVQGPVRNASGFCALTRPSIGPPVPSPQLARPPSLASCLKSTTAAQQGIAPWRDATLASIVSRSTGLGAPSCLGLSTSRARLGMTNAHQTRCFLQMPAPDCSVPDRRRRVGDLRVLMSALRTPRMGKKPPLAWVVQSERDRALGPLAQTSVQLHTRSCRATRGSSKLQSP